MGCGGKSWSLVLAQPRSSPLTVSCPGSQDVELRRGQAGAVEGTSCEPQPPSAAVPPGDAGGASLLWHLPSRCPERPQ